MKVFVLTLLVTICFSGDLFSQDTIVFVDDSRIGCKVLKLEEESIRYRLGGKGMPTRVVSRKKVRRIIYQNGNIEVITSVKEELEANSKFERREMLSSGFYFSGLIGGGAGNHWIVNQKYPYGYSIMHLGVATGNKWFFGKSHKMRFGLNACWARLGAYFEFGEPEYFVVAPFNIGLASAFDVGPKSGIELNTFSGLNFLIDLKRDNMFINGIELKYRLNRLAIGVDYSYSFFSRGSFHIANLSFGFKI